MLTRAGAVIAAALLFQGTAWAAGIEWDAKSRTINFSSEEPTLTTVAIDGSSYVRIDVPGLSSLADLGEPMLPAISRLIAVPAGHEPHATVKIKASVSLPDGIVPAYLDKDCRHCNMCDTAFGPNEDAYKALTQTPSVTFSEVSHVGPVPVSMMRVNPVQFREDGKAEYVTEMEIRLEFVPAAHRTAAPIDAKASNDREFYAALVLNPEDLPAFGAARASKDLILAHSTFREALAPLIAFKESTGRVVDVRYYDNPDRSQIQSVIREQYASSEPPTHVLLVGSVDHVPSHWTGRFWSDYPYSLLDAGNLPDLSIGRLAARNPGELTRQIDKIINRETTPRNNAKFLMTSGFETSWCQVNLQFIIDNIYARSRSPLDVTKLYASNGHRTDSVVQGYNAGPNVIVYDGHGDPTGMTEIPLKTQHLPRLENTSYPLIMDIACNNAFWGSRGAAASSYNFAESIAALEAHGAAGIMASSYYSGGHDLFRYVFRAAIYDDRSPRDPYHGINEVGTMIHFAKVKYLEQTGGSGGALDDNRMFFWLGDPASTMFEQGAL